MRTIEYLDSNGESPFARWFGRIDAAAASKVTVALARIEAGNLSNAKSVGSGVFEYRMDWGPGYRLYFGRDGDQIVVFVGRWNQATSAG